MIATTSLDFASTALRADIVHDAVEYPVRGAVVVNLAPTDGTVHAPVPSVLPALESSVVVDAQVSGSLLGVFTVDGQAIAADARSSWTDFYRSLGADAGGRELLRSPQHAIGHVELDLVDVLRQPVLGPPTAAFDVLVNAWFAPAGTACGIHDEHGFIEIHTQLAGHGRIQKFRTDDPATLYEEYPMCPGVTSPASVCRVCGPGFTYPWHQYFADTDCVWLAAEYRPR